MDNAAKQPRILILGLNPAWQKTLCLPHWRKGEINRVASCTAMASGKGVNTLQAMRSLQLGNQAVLVQFAGGATGKMVADNLTSRGLTHITIPVVGGTRVCTTLLDRSDGTMTELIEPSPRVGAGELRLLRECLREQLPVSRTVVLCGTLPQGVPSQLYGDIVEHIRSRAWVVIDAWRDAQPALAAGPHLLKINGVELKQLTGHSDQQVAVQELFRQYQSLLWVAITNGPEPASFHSRQQGWCYRLPNLKRTLSPLGAGDTATGIMAGNIEKALGPRSGFDCRTDEYRQASQELAAVFRTALAAASASCLKAHPAMLQVDDVQRIEKKIRMQEAGS